MSTDLSKTNQGLFAEIRNLIAESKQRVAVSVNAELSMLY